MSYQLFRKINETSFNSYRHSKSLLCQRKQSDSSLNELNIPISSNLDSIDPAISYDVVSGNILYQTYETLYQYHYLKRPLTLEPLLAKEMPQFSNDLKKGHNKN